MKAENESKIQILKDRVSENQIHSTTLGYLKNILSGTLLNHY
jgi:hypothetical protein